MSRYDSNMRLAGNTVFFTPPLTSVLSHARRMVFLAVSAVLAPSKRAPARFGTSAMSKSCQVQFFEFLTTDLHPANESHTQHHRPRQIPLHR